MDIISAIDDRNLFGPWFRHRDKWTAWLVLLRNIFGLPLNSAADLAIYKECTGRETPPSQAMREAWLICGRRSRKTFVISLVGTYLAAFHSYRQYLAPGERATVLVIASDRKQARIAMRFIRGLLYGIPFLKIMVERETADSFDLSNGTTIEISAASYSSVRGYAIVAALLDELAFWDQDNSANPDTEILAALRPGMATIPNSMLLIASSPYAQRGALYETYQKYYGKLDPNILVWRAPTLVMNPSVPQSIIDDAMERDPIAAAAEWMAQFRSDVESFITKEALAAVTNSGAFERGPIPGFRYAAFVDPSGGSSDSFTLAITHLENDIAILDALREVKPPFSPAAVVSEFADLVKNYSITTVTGDRYAGEFPRELFRKKGITYELSDRSKSDIYVGALALINSKRVELLDNSRLIRQFLGLERRTARGGRESIDHSPGGHDDLCNAAAGALLLVSKPLRTATTAQYDVAGMRIRSVDEWNSELTRRGLTSRDALVGRNQLDRDEKPTIRWRTFW